MDIKPFWNKERREYLSATFSHLFLLLIAALGTSEVLRLSWWIKLIVFVGAVAILVIGVIIRPPKGGNE